jgi:hypothetical protein
MKSIKGWNPKRLYWAARNNPYALTETERMKLWVHGYIPKKKNG